MGSCPGGRLDEGGSFSGVGGIRVGRGRGVGGGDLLIEREACRSRLIIKTDEVWIVWVRGRARDFSEPPVVVGGVIPEGDAFRDGVGREGK